MSPVIIDRIKKAKGQVRIVPVNEDRQVSTTSYAIQIMEGSTWVSVFTDHDRNICEQALRKANSKVILG